MGVLEVLNERGLEAIGRFYSIYRAVVIDNNDPDKMNRVKVMVPQFNNSVSEWAYPRGQDGSMKSGFKYLTPKIGQLVFIEFECGDPLYPIWSYCGWATSEIPDELNGPYTFGVVTPSSHSIIIEDKKGELNISIADSNEEEVSSIKIIRGEIYIKGTHINMMGAKQGITLTDKLVEKLNQLEREVNNLKTLLSAAPNVAIPSDGGKAAFSSLLSWSSKQISPTIMGDIENKEVLQ